MNVHSCLSSAPTYARSKIRKVDWVGDLNTFPIQLLPVLKSDFQGKGLHVRVPIVFIVFSAKNS